MEREQNLIAHNAAPTLADAFHERVLRTPHARAYTAFRDGRWQDMSWQQTQDAVAFWQEAMRRDGLAPGDRIAIMCSNRWEWVLCDQAALGLGLVSVPVFSNDRSGNIAWILEDADIRWILIEGEMQLRSLSEDPRCLSRLQHIVILQPVDSNLPQLRALDDWLPHPKPGGSGPEYRREPVEGEDLATIVYTSGTTGHPKGVMLSHRNILFNVHAALSAVSVSPHDSLLSFLPLSHTFERTVGYYLPVVSGARVAFSRGIPQLAEDLLAIRPTLMISVPRIFERVYARLRKKIDSGPRWRQRLVDRAIELGWRRFERQQGRARWTPGLLLQPLLDLLVGRKVRAGLGGALRCTVCGGAALNPEIARLFIGLGVPILQGYGLTETSPVVAVNRIEDNLPESVGSAIPGVEVAIGPGDELLTRSPSVMLGYWNNPDATAAMIDRDGWLHSGDRAGIDPGGHIRITGRMKEIIVLSNGEKVPPGDMENAIALDELVDQVMVIGEGRPYLSALVVPNRSALEQVAQALHLNPANQPFHDDPRMCEAVLDHIEARTRGFPGFARIREVALIEEPWTPDNGLLTPTLKLRREQILDHCWKDTERLYAGH